MESERRKGSAYPQGVSQLVQCGAALVGLARLLVLVFAGLGAISLALHEARKTLA